MLLEGSQGPGLDFREAVDGRQGLELCRSAAPDCVLLDHKLPDMTGLEFITRLADGSPNEDPTMAVVILTGVSSEHQAMDALRAGAQDYLVKDRVTAESLSLVVEKATGKMGLIRALRAERDRLAASLVEKEALLKEVHHRVKNNLQVIVSLLRLQAESIQSPQLRSALAETQNRVNSMALIHEQLYETADLNEVDLAINASALATRLFHSYAVTPGQIRLEINMDHPLPVTVDRAIPAGLILNELISNALKHAFPEGQAGSIRILGRRCRGEIELVVADDGVGLPPEIDTKRPRSLGLEIVKILSHQLRGSFEAVRVQGTEFRITFPAGWSRDG
jgi:two-component sensor histidine kinase